MSAPSTLTGQDIGEAQGAVRALLDGILAITGTTGNEYIALRVLSVRGPYASAAQLGEFLAGQAQLDLDPAGADKLLSGLQAQGLATSGDGPIQLTEAGRARYAELGQAIVPTTKRLYADIDPNDLAVAHRVLGQVVETATRLRAELKPPVT